MNTRGIGLAALAALGVLATACNPTVQLVAAGGGGGGGGTSAGTGGGGAIGGQATLLSDAESAGVLSALNGGEVQLAQAVMSRLTNADARAFAQRMITEHTAVNQTEATLFTQQGISPQPSAVSTALNNAAQEVLASLNGLSGSALDSAYMASQVLMHQQALGLIDCVVMPSLMNSAVRSFVTGTVRPGVAAHLTSAESISASLGGGMAAVGSGDAGTSGAQSDCSVACVPQSSGGLFPDPLRTAACLTQ